MSEPTQKKTSSILVRDVDDARKRLLEREARLLGISVNSLCLIKLGKVLTADDIVRWFRERTLG